MSFVNCFPVYIVQYHYMLTYFTTKILLHLTYLSKKELDYGKAKQEDHWSCKRSPDTWTKEVSEKMFETRFM